MTLTLVERSHFANRLRGIAQSLDRGERDHDFIEAAHEPIALRCIMVDLLREIAEAVENGERP
jgi:hypothetical protein